MDERRVFMNPRLWFVDHDGHRVVFYHHQPIYRVALGDRVHLRYVAVNLRLSELATQEEIAQAFGHSVATQRRWERRFQEKGIKGLEDRRPSHATTAVGQGSGGVCSAVVSRLGCPTGRWLGVWGYRRRRSGGR